MPKNVHALLLCVALTACDDPVEPRPEPGEGPRVVELIALGPALVDLGAAAQFTILGVNERGDTVELESFGCTAAPPLASTASCLVTGAGFGTGTLHVTSGNLSADFAVGVAPDGAVLYPAPSVSPQTLMLASLAGDSLARVDCCAGFSAHDEVDDWDYGILPHTDTIAYPRADSSLVVLDVGTGDTAVIRPIVAQPRAPAFSPAGDSIYFISGNYLWVTSIDGSGTRPLEFDDEAVQACTGYAYCTSGYLAVSPDGGTLAWVINFHTGVVNEAVLSMDLATGAIDTVMHVDRQSLRNLQYRPDGSGDLAVSGQGMVTVHPGDGSAPYTVDFSQGVWTYAWSPDGELMLGMLEDRRFEIVEVESGASIRYTPEAQPSYTYGRFFWIPGESVVTP